MKRAKLPPGDEYQIRCPKLGHQIPFSYCRSENMGLPCFKTLDCWFEHFSVEAYLQRDMKTDEWDKAFKKPINSKINSLMDLIEKAKG